MNREKVTVTETTRKKVSLCILEVWDTLIAEEWVEVLVFYTHTEV